VHHTPQDRPLRRDEAAAFITENYFPCSPRTLAKWAVTGGGPAYRKAARVPLYDISDLREFAERRMSAKVRSSSELRAAA
jgi:hypothetical protein